MIRCTVRDCGQPLVLSDRQAACPRGHTFDRAKSGYWNLLQPQDRRSLHAGDTQEAVAARRRLFDAGFFAPLAAALAAALAPAIEATGRAGPVVLDVGCGEGSHLAALCARLGAAEGCGIDLSVPAVELAARSHPALTWVVANADRGLPLVDAGVDVALSITARRPIAELGRVLKPRGLLLIAVPAPDDLAELRAAVLGDDERRDRMPTVLSELAAVPDAFEIVNSRIVRHRVLLDRQALADLAVTTYRGGRKARTERLAEYSAEAREGTGAWDFVVVRRRVGSVAALPSPL